MILLLGGTIESAPLAEALAGAGFSVLVSTATDVPLDVGGHPAVSRIAGRMSGCEMAAVVAEKGCWGIVDAGHPYAVQLHEEACSAARLAGIPIFRFERPTCVVDGVHFADGHEDAAKKACGFGRPVLLTTGSRNLELYTKIFGAHGARWAARVLDCVESRTACDGIGLDGGEIIFGRGPFSVDDNRKLIREHGIGVVVTKDSGEAGGVNEKIEAARSEGCEIIVVRRPQQPMAWQVYGDVGGLVGAVRGAFEKRPVLAVDLESVLVPEIWETVARETGWEELKTTTRESADWESLMRERLDFCRSKKITFARLLEIVERMEPLPGALEFLEFAKARMEVVVVSDSFDGLARPLIEKLGLKNVFCHRMVLDEAGFLSGWMDGKRVPKAERVMEFQEQGRAVVAVGDSFNDLEMLCVADEGFLIKPTAAVKESVMGVETVENFMELKEACNGFLNKFYCAGSVS